MSLILLIFCGDTLFLNEHAQLKKWFKLKKTSVNDPVSLILLLIFCVDILFLNEHAQLKKWTKLKETGVKTLLNDHCP